MADNNEEDRINVNNFDFANEGANEETPMLVNYLITRLQQAMSNSALQGEDQQQLQAYGFLPPYQEERVREKSLGETSKRRISKVDPSRHEDAMKSILYEADARDHDPVHGCYGIITLLQAQAEVLQEELDCLRMQIRMHQQQQVLAAAAAAQATTTSNGQLQPLSLNNLCPVNPSNKAQTNQFLMSSWLYIIIISAIFFLLSASAHKHRTGLMAFL
ncbi:hypothetical protein L7F22_055992 [Adiantum nelumboides]|nr:hypothetical protein [Adiantum nelumboides]